jgi:hypothetical protein
MGRGLGVGSCPGVQRADNLDGNTWLVCRTLTLGQNKVFIEKKHKQDLRSNLFHPLVLEDGCRAW